MQIKNVYAVYFSATGTSRCGAETIACGLGSHIHRYDLTICNQQPTLPLLTPEDVVVFGSPVYRGRLYSGACDRFARLQGNRTPCVVTVTYGNRDYEDALLEMADLARARGFIPLAGAALIGQHTYGQVQVGRPNAQDRAEDLEFAVRVRELLEADELLEVELPGNRPYKIIQGPSGGIFRPSTSNDCTECGLCVELCPEQAIDHADCRTIDDARCIGCFRCIQVCPVQAKYMDHEGYHKAAAELTVRLIQRRENEYFFTQRKVGNER